MVVGRVTRGRRFLYVQAAAIDALPATNPDAEQRDVDDDRYDAARI
jgi:hypothetical protein